MDRRSSQRWAAIAGALACLAAATASASGAPESRLVEVRSAFEPPGAAEPGAPHELSLEVSRELRGVFVATVGAAFARDPLDAARFSSPALTFAATRSHMFGNVEAELAIEHAWVTAVDSEATREWTAGLTLRRGVWRAGAELGAATASGTELVERHAELSVGVELVRDFELEVAWRTGDEPGARADVFGLRIVFARSSARFRTDSPFAPYYR